MTEQNHTPQPDRWPNLQPPAQAPGPYHHPYPPANLRVPPPPPAPRPPAWIRVFAVIGGLAVAVLLAVSAGAIWENTRVKGFPAPVSESPSPSWSHRVETAPPVPRPGADAPSDVSTEATYLDYAEAREIMVGAYDEVLDETESSCSSALDMADSGHYIGLLVINPSCLDEVELYLDTAVDSLAGTRYGFYVRGANWLITFDNKTSARAFVAVVGHGLEVRRA